MIGLMLLDIWQALWCLPFFSRSIVRIEGCAVLEKHDLDKKKEPAKGGEMKCTPIIGHFN